MSRSAFDRGLWDGCGKELPFCKARFNPLITLFEGWDLLPRLDLSRDSSGISGWTGIEHVIPDFAILTVRSDI